MEAVTQYPNIHSPEEAVELLEKQGLHPVSVYATGTVRKDQWTGEATLDHNNFMLVYFAGESGFEMAYWFKYLNILNVFVTPREVSDKSRHVPYPLNVGLSNVDGESGESVASGRTESVGPDPDVAGDEVDLDIGMDS